jgi:hypothetical protein
MDVATLRNAELGAEFFLTNHVYLAGETTKATVGVGATEWAMCRSRTSDPPSMTVDNGH